MARTTKFAFALLAMSFSPWQSYGQDVNASPSKPILCGILERAAGHAQVLDPSRTKLIEPQAKTALPCGAWASVGSEGGNIAIRLKENHRVQIGAGSFIQISGGADQIILFRGYVYVESNDEGSEIRILTPNGRARMGRGKSIVLFSTEKDETQFVSMENRGTLENRFEQNPRRVQANQGEATTLSSKQLKTYPTVSRAVAVAALKEKLSLLPLSEADQNDAVFIAHERNQRIFPEVEDAEVIEQGRSIASELKSKSYDRYSLRPEDQELKAKFMNHVDPSGVTLKGKGRMPASNTGLARHGLLAIKDPAQALRNRQVSEEQREKKRVIEALKHIESD